MLLKVCGCGKLIPQTKKRCETCEEKRQSRHVAYNKTRRNKRAADFYVSKEWRTLRQCIISIFDNVDIYALYVENELLTCEEVHHIVEMEEDWNQRLNPLNLIPLNKRTHSTISALYKKSDAMMKVTQKQLHSLIEKHFKGVGGIKKVLYESFLVPSPDLFGENSPREISELKDEGRGCHILTRKEKH